MTMMTSIILVLVYLVVTHGFVRFATTTTHNSFRLHQSTPTTLVEDMSNVAFIVLAGGTGSRMKATMPKQFLSLRGIPILHYSLHLLLEELPIYCQGHDISPPPLVVLVMDPKYQPEYQYMVDKYNGKLVFASPGIERQGSVQNGLHRVVESIQCDYVAIHDSARPLVTMNEIINVLHDAKQMGTAAVLGVPCKATMKECVNGKVIRTIPRSTLWEVHTPQVISTSLLLRGYEEQSEQQFTDDVSIVEALGEPVQMTLGEYTNLKITTPEDIMVATAILEDRNAPLFVM